MLPYPYHYETSSSINVVYSSHSDPLSDGSIPSNHASDPSKHISTIQAGMLISLEHKIVPNNEYMFNKYLLAGWLDGE